MKDKLLVWTFLLYIFTFSILGIVLKDKEISLVERRKLNTLPKITLNENYIKDVDKYLLDQFPFRDSLKNIKAVYNLNILQKYDNNNIYIKDNYIFKSIYPTNKKSITNFIDKTNKIKDLFNNSNTYIMIIPDKNYYLEEENFLQIDYDYLLNEIKTLDMTFVDITNVMELNDYYETDTHFKQENLEKVILEMSKTMNFTYKEEKYTINEYNNFYGVYYGESPLNRKPETIKYLTNETIDNAVVKYLENEKLKKVYNLDKLVGLDAYEVYLDGASSFIEIYNENNSTDKELIIFRDSFASSLTPLLIKYYSKITLIDNRYIDIENFSKLIEINDQDVLFAYSTLFVNDSYSLKG